MAITKQGCIYPTNYELVALQQAFQPELEDDRLGLQLLPIKTSQNAKITFQTPENFQGAQKWRGLGKDAGHSGMNWNPFGKICQVDPGYWGETECISEEFLTQAAPMGSCGSAIDLGEHIANLTRGLMQRRFTRMEINIWQTLLFGHYEAQGPSGKTVASFDYPVDRINVSVPWSNYKKATPLKDFRCLITKARATSASFGACARYIMNQTTANCLFSNQNPNDVGKVGLSACCDFMGPDMVNNQFAAQGLGSIEIYEGRYIDDNGQIQMYIPTGLVLAVGCRPNNDPLGHYYMTRNVMGCTVDSGPYMGIHDNCDNGMGEARRITVSDAHNGGPGLHYPDALCVIDTGCTDDC